MDPEVCVRRAEEAMDAGDPAEAAAACEDFRLWLYRGGWSTPSLTRRIQEIEEELERS